MVSGLRFVTACPVCIFDLVIPGLPVGFLLEFDAALPFEVLPFIHLKEVQKCPPSLDLDPGLVPYQQCDLNKSQVN